MSEQKQYPLLILQCKKEHMHKLSEEVSDACVNNKPLIVDDSVRVYAFDEELRLLSDPNFPRCNS